MLSRSQTTIRYYTYNFGGNKAHTVCVCHTNTHNTNLFNGMKMSEQKIKQRRGLRIMTTKKVERKFVYKKYKEIVLVGNKQEEKTNNNNCCPPPPSCDPITRGTAVLAAFFLLMSSRLTAANSGGGSVNGGISSNPPTSSSYIGDAFDGTAAAAASALDPHQHQLYRTLAFPNSRLDSLAHAPLSANLLPPTPVPTVAVWDRLTVSATDTSSLTPQWMRVSAIAPVGAMASDATAATAVVAAATTADETDWWSNAIEEDTFESPLAFDATENGLWNGRFVPPPPRPPFLDESVAADGLTTCDLCTWAWQRNAYSLDGSMDPSGEIGWTLTLIIVSVISALIGAIVMVIFLRCRRIKTGNGNGGRQQAWWCRNNRNNSQTTRSSLSIKHPTDSIRRPTSNSGVWTWLGSRRSSAGPDQIGPPSSSPAENHYTHMDDAYSPVGASEALYAELDRESVRSANPSYQNTAYSQCEEKYNFQQHEQDIPMVVSSAPSSAYYSDLSVTAMPGGGGNERAYEVVGLTVMSQPLPHWDSGGGGSHLVAGHPTAPTSSSAAGTSAAAMLGSGDQGGILTSQRRIPRLAAINETSTSTVPSDYV